MFTLLLLSLLHTTTCTVYTVTPDDPNTTCHHCHNLQHYRRNAAKYFTSNTQLLLLPGLHHLHKNLIIQNFHNISLIGAGTTQEVVIQCADSFDSVGILIANITNLVIRNLLIKDCVYNEYDHYWDEELEATLVIKECNFVTIYQLKMISSLNNEYCIIGLNIMGDSYFGHVSCHGIKLLYFEAKQLDREHNTISIDNYHGISAYHSLEFRMVQNSYYVTLELSNMTVSSNGPINFQGDNIGNSEVIIMNSHFKWNSFPFFYFSSSKNGWVHFKNCKFLSNPKTNTAAYDLVLITVESEITLNITNCVFRLSNIRLLQVEWDDRALVTVTIKNTTISSTTLMNNHKVKCLIMTSYTRLHLIGTVIFNNNSVINGIIVLTTKSDLIIDGELKFTNNTALSIIDFQHNSHEYIMINKPSVVNINHNYLCALFNSTSSVVTSLYPFCIFQYISYANLDDNIKHENFSIRFHYNYYNNNMCMLQRPQNMPTTNCRWLPHSAFNTTLPLDVNKEYIQYTDSTGTYNRLPHVNEPNTLCICLNMSHYDCSITDLGFIYPGQTLKIPLHHYTAKHNNSTAIVTLTSDPNIPLCGVLHGNQYQQTLLSSQLQCTIVNYTIYFPTSGWCKLLFKTVLPVSDNVNMFTVRQLQCPLGFTKTDGICQCYSKFKEVGITQCDIADQIILRPANSWIFASTMASSEIYHICLHCPLHYCNPHSSRLNLSYPNSQCQFNRYGILCGQCQPGLSTVFGSAHCQHCSNIYFLLIVPIAMAGLFLVFVLFTLNLTVTNGAINGLVFYANIISINASIFFSEFTPAYTFISLANLDLGIETCFYNGMDDYAKMWLQLSFPAYLILIATSLIITSRYSTKIQRMTARRVLPVLATLFLLFYTKILRIVSSALFFYSPVTQLPSGQTMLMWSVDANVPLFGAKFTTLFIVCLVIFVLLIPFNILLLFTKTLSKFKQVNKFKPLLDAYQGPYKNKFYYWTGLQLFTRTIFFAVSSLERNTNLVIGSVFIGVLIGIHGVSQPFKAKVNNYHELLFLFNLHGLFVLSLYSHNMTTTNVMAFMAALHFSFIVIYQIITCLCSDSTKYKMWTRVSRLTSWITVIHGKPQTRPFELHNSIRSKIPEVAYNYSQYQEPLLDV